MANNTTSRSFQIPAARGDLPMGILCGVVFSFGLFVLMAIAPLVGMQKPDKTELSEPVMAFPSPEIEEVEEPPPPEEPEEEPPPEMDEPPPEISLEQLEIALNPGTGGSLAGDFALPTVSSDAKDLGTEDFIDFSELDDPPKLLDSSPFNFPKNLRRKQVALRMIVYIELDTQGNVSTAQVKESSHPEFNSHIIHQIERRKFSPPTLNGRAVKARANLPINIDIK